MVLHNYHTFNGNNLYHSFVAGAKNLISYEATLNKINVFPVADADTGTNLAHTMQAIISQTAPVSNIKQVALALSEAALNGARGNSGVIFAQFIYGFAQSALDEEAMTISQFSQCINQSVKHAYQALSAPREGTILTVMREWSGQLTQLNENCDSFKHLLERAIEYAKISLAQTTDKLEVLKRHHVVDAGAQGFVAFLEGINNYIVHGTTNTLPPREYSSPMVITHTPDKKPRFRYCTQATLTHITCPVNKIRALANKLGNAVVMAGNQKHLHIHLHTNRPDYFIATVMHLGKITHQKAEDIHAQYQILHDRKSDIGLLTDSACDLPQNMIDQYQIQVVPAQVHLNGIAYIDNITIKSKHFYKDLAKSREPAKTAAPSLAAFAIKQQLMRNNYPHVIAMHTSAAISSIHNNSNLAAREQGNNIEVINSRTLSGALGLLTLRTARAAESGMSYITLIKNISVWIKKTNLYVSPATMKQFIKSGRVPRLSGTLAHLLRIFPIIAVDNTGNGTIEHKSFTRKASINKIETLFKEKLKHHELWGFAVVHANNPRLAKNIAANITAICGQPPEFITAITPVIGANAGQGAVGLAIMWK